MEAAGGTERQGSAAFISLPLSPSLTLSIKNTTFPCLVSLTESSLRESQSHLYRTHAVFYPFQALQLYRHWVPHPLLSVQYTALCQFKAVSTLMQTLLETLLLDIE